MNINKSISFDSHNQMSAQYRNRYADVNEVKVNSQGLSGMLFCFDTTNTSAHKQIIDISDEGKQKLFDMVKSEFIKESGVHNGDTTNRTKIYTDYLKNVPEKDRAKASWTLDRLEAEYWSGFAEKAKQSDPAWEPGNPFDRDFMQGLEIQDVSGAVDKQSNKELDIRI